MLDPIRPKFYKSSTIRFDESRLGWHTAIGAINRQVTGDSGNKSDVESEEFELPRANRHVEPEASQASQAGNQEAGRPQELSDQAVDPVPEKEEESLESSPIGLDPEERKSTRESTHELAASLPATVEVRRSGRNKKPLQRLDWLSTTAIGKFAYS